MHNIINRSIHVVGQAHQGNHEMQHLLPSSCVPAAHLLRSMHWHGYEVSAFVGIAVYSVLHNWSLEFQSAHSFSYMPLHVARKLQFLFCSVFLVAKQLVAALPEQILAD
jgi:hypothetical protein